MNYNCMSKTRILALMANNLEFQMTRFISLALFTLMLAVPLSSYALFGKDDPEKARKELREARTAALEKLYAEKPASRSSRLLSVEVQVAW